MSAEDVFNVRRNAYRWALQYDLNLRFHGENKAWARRWCASRYVSNLVEKILLRKAAVDSATAQQGNMKVSAKKPPPPLPAHLREEGPSRRRVPEVMVRLENAVSGEAVWVVMMNPWAVLGDAIAKANMQMDQSRRSLRGELEDGTPGDENDRWYLVAQNETSVRGRIRDILKPNQEVIDIPVVKMPKSPPTTEFGQMERVARPWEVPKP